MYFYKVRPHVMQSNIEDLVIYNVANFHLFANIFLSKT